VITRALGSKPDIEVDTYCGKLVPGDTLLLCTDGLSEYVQPGEMQAILSQHPPQEATLRLIALANERGGNDNITALVVQAVPVAMTARLEDTVPVAAQPKDAHRKGLSLPLVALLVGGGLIVVAALVAGSLFLRQMLGAEDVTATPTVTVPPPTASATVLPATATVPPTEGAATATLAPRLDLLEPADETTFAPGEEVTFRWKAMGVLLESFSFVVRTSREGYDQLCQSDEQEICTATLDEEGEYEWWAELLHNGQSIVKSSPRTLYIRAPVTQTAAPTTPTPPLSETALPTTTP
jgi:hypothetical protein